MIEIVQLTAEHCERMAREVRMGDRLEMAAMTGEPDTLEARRETLLALHRRSRGYARAGIYDGALVNIWGVLTRTPISRVGNPWMVTTDAALRPEVRRAMAHRCRAAFVETIPPYVAGLWNLVDERNTAAIAWLKWLKFEFEGEPIEHGGARWLKFGMGEYVL